MKAKWIVAVVLLALIGGGLGLWFHGEHPSPASTATIAPSLPIITTNPVSPADINTSQKLLSAAQQLATAQSVEDRNSALARLHEAIASGTTNEIVAAIRAVLDTKVDGATGKGFKIGGGGTLLEAPTLRTQLLEELARLDPAAAAAYAREILDSSSSPDEWALALRNLARGDSSAEARGLLETKTAELLRNEAWQKEPSVGYLEAFDTAVHLGSAKLISPLTELVSKKDNQAVAHAAFLTLDRLVINDPATALTALSENPTSMLGREETRANYFARADVGDPTQRRLVEVYLLDESRSPQELTAFAGVFPNANFMISHNLLTENKTLDGATLRQRDLASLAVVNEWLADSRFENRRAFLETMRSRLNEFTRSAAR